MLVNFLIAGVQKGGTSALWKFLQYNPEISMSKVKEPGYFSSKEFSDTPNAIADYHHQWSKLSAQKKAIGEASDQYLLFPEAAERIKRYNPSMKFIIVLRDPVKRAYSQYQMQSLNGTAPGAFEDLVLEEIENPNSPYVYLKKGLYAKQLREYFNYFPREQFLIIRNEDLLSQHNKVMKEIQDFLGVTPIVIPPKIIHHNEYFPIDPQIESVLRKVFIPDITELESMLNWDLRIWKGEINISSPIDDTVQQSPKVEGSNEFELQNMLKQIQESMATKKYKNALVVLNQILSINAKFSEIQYLRGVCLVELRNYELAFQAFQLELKINPTHTESTKMVNNLQTVLDSQRPPVFMLGSAHKVGSTWLYRILRDVLKESGVVAPQIPAHLNEHGVINLNQPDEVIRFTQELNQVSLFKTHNFAPKAGVFPANFKWVTVIRHPKDVLVSAAIYLSKLDSSKGGRSEDQAYMQSSTKDQIITLIEEGSWIGERLLSWYRSKNAYCLRYENMKKDLEAEFVSLAKFLEIDYNKDVFHKVNELNSVEKQKSIIHRKGIVGDWKNHFDGELLRIYQNHNNGYWTKIESELGY